MSRLPAELLARCPHCGELLVGGKRRRVCPRCHPERAESDDQLELLLDAPISAEGSTAEDAELLPAQPEPSMEETPELLDFPGPFPEPAVPLRWSPRRRLAAAAASLIVIGGIGWAAFQMWPQGSVEQSIVRAFEALPHFLERTGTENPLAGISVGGDSSPTFADLNGDGLLDLVTGSQSGAIHVFLNTGSRTAPRFARGAEAAYGLVATDTSSAVAFADLRGTGKLEALNAGTSGAPSYYFNRGNRKQPDFVILAPEDDPFAALGTPERSYDWRPIFADIDHDGDADLFVGTRDGSILFCENRGTAQKPQFRGVTRVGAFGLRGLGLLVSLGFGDLDGDGDLDVIAANASGELLFLENRGNPWRPKFVLTPPATLGLTLAGREATVALADLDGDGDLDCVTGGADGRLRYFENLRTPALTGKPGP